MKHNAPVIILGGHYAALDLARRLGRKKIEVYVHDPSPNAIALKSRYVQPLVIGASSKTLLRAIQNLGDQKPIIFVTSDAALTFLAEHMDALKHIARFPYEDAALIQTLLDKNTSAALFTKEDIPTPSTYLIESLTKECPLSAPLVLKPAQQTQWSLSPAAVMLTNGHKALKIESTDAITPTITRLMMFGPMIAQDYINGGDGDLYYFVGYRDKQGEMLCTFTGRKIRTVQNNMGSETILRSEHDQDIETLGRAIFNKLNLQGVAGIDIKRDPITEKLYVIEINYRFGLSDGLVSAAGIDLPALYYAEALGLPMPEARTYRAGIYWVWLEKELERNRSSVCSFMKSLGFLMAQAVCGKLSINEWDIRDPAPFISVLMSQMKPHICKPPTSVRKRYTHAK